MKYLSPSEVIVKWNWMVDAALLCNRCPRFALVTIWSTPWLGSRFAASVQSSLSKLTSRCVSRYIATRWACQLVGKTWQVDFSLSGLIERLFVGFWVVGRIWLCRGGYLPLLNSLLRRCLLHHIDWRLLSWLVGSVIVIRSCNCNFFVIRHVMQFGFRTMCRMSSFGFGRLSYETSQYPQSQSRPHCNGYASSIIILLSCWLRFAYWVPSPSPVHTSSGTVVNSAPGGLLDSSLWVLAVVVKRCSRPCGSTISRKYHHRSVSQFSQLFPSCAYSCWPCLLVNTLHGASFQHFRYVDYYLQGFLIPVRSFPSSLNIVPPPTINLVRLFWVPYLLERLDSMLIQKSIVVSNCVSGMSRLSLGHIWYHIRHCNSPL